MKCKLVSVSKPVIDGVDSAEELVAYCARVSNPANQANKKSAAKLVKYLIENDHWSPLEMVHVVIEIETTRDIARQILRHRSFSFQEFSQRYAQVVDFSEPRETRLQDNKNRQNSHENYDENLTKWWSLEQSDLMQHASSLYGQALDMGVAKEQARAVLPEGLTVSKLYMSGTLRSWVHYCQLRMANGTQKEHMEIAKECWAIIAQEFPAIAEIFIVDELEEVVEKFASAVLAKLKQKRDEGKSGWEESHWSNDCYDAMEDHLANGEIISMAGYAAFAHWHGWEN